MYSPNSLFSFSGICFKNLHSRSPSKNLVQDTLSKVLENEGSAYVPNVILSAVHGSYLKRGQDFPFVIIPERLTIPIVTSW